MAKVKFHCICDRSGCGQTSEEYVFFPVCTDCNDECCPQHMMWVGEDNQGICLSCGDENAR